MFIFHLFIGVNHLFWLPLLNDLYNFQGIVQLPLMQLCPLSFSVQTKVRMIAE